MSEASGVDVQAIEKVIRESGQGTWRKISKALQVATRKEAIREIRRDPEAAETVADVLGILVSGGETKPAMASTRPSRKVQRDRGSIKF